MASRPTRRVSSNTTCQLLLLYIRVCLRTRVEDCLSKLWVKLLAVCAHAVGNEKDNFEFKTVRGPGVAIEKDLHENKIKKHSLNKSCPMIPVMVDSIIGVLKNTYFFSYRYQQS